MFKILNTTHFYGTQYLCTGLTLIERKTKQLNCKSNESANMWNITNNDSLGAQKDPSNSQYDSHMKTGLEPGHYLLARTRYSIQSDGVVL